MKKKSLLNSLRPHSSILVDDPERAAARARLYPVGFTEEDLKKSIIGIASTWSNVTPCNMHIDHLALEAGLGARPNLAALRTRQRSENRVRGWLLLARHIDRVLSWSKRCRFPSRLREDYE